MAPAGTETASSHEWQRREEERVLARLNELSRSSVESRNLADPLLRRDLELAAVALAGAHRWEDLVELTAAVDRSVRSSPPTVVNLRAAALERLGDTSRSVRLLVELAKDVLESGRRDPTTLYQLADLLALQGEYSLAKKLTARAYSQLRSEALGQRVRQLELEERLATSSKTLESDHFEIRFSPGGEEVVERMVRILESERMRLGQVIPIQSDRKIEVHALSIYDFYGQYDGAMGVIGVFDGRIRVPFADAWGLPPELVAVLTHELAHAMISDFTHNQAPKWVQEGLAQFVEMVSTRANPIADYVRSGRYLSFPMIEEVLAGFSNVKLVAAAYDQSFWTFCYLETRYGAAGIRELLRAFRDGLTTEAALFELFSTTPSDLDRELREWWLRDAPRAWVTRVHEYERWTNPYLQRPGEEAFQVKIQTKWWEQN
jgi:hypothetical protein